MLILSAAQIVKDLRDAGLSDEDIHALYHGKSLSLSPQAADAVKSTEKAGWVASHEIGKGQAVSALTAAQHGGSAALGMHGMTPEQSKKLTPPRKAATQERKDALDAASRREQVGIRQMAKGYAVSGLVAAEHGSSAALGMQGFTPEQAARFARASHAFTANQAAP